MGPLVTYCPDRGGGPASPRRRPGGPEASLDAEMCGESSEGTSVQEDLDLVPLGLRIVCLAQGLPSARLGRLGPLSRPAGLTSQQRCFPGFASLSWPGTCQP